MKTTTDSKSPSPRREFIRRSLLLGGGVAFGTQTVFSNRNLYVARSNSEIPEGNIKSVGYAAQSATSGLNRWEFERRPLGDLDILINIKYSSICHSDIHQIKGHWGPQTYPQTPGHEIAGIVAAVGKNVTKFKVGDRAGVGCMVNSCMECASCLNGEEQHCDNRKTLYTYGNRDEKSPTGITQGGYSTNIVVTEHFAVHIPTNIKLEDAAPLLCSGITTYSPLMKERIKKGDKVGVVGIGGLGHMAVKLAVAKGAEVYAFTTTPEKIQDILSFGAKDVIVVDSPQKLFPYAGMLDFVISTVPYQFDVTSYLMTVKPYGTFTQVGLPPAGTLNVNAFVLAGGRVNFTGSMIGGIPETQEVIDFCALNKIYPKVEIINPEEINAAWDKVEKKQARYRYVIDMQKLK